MRRKSQQNLPKYQRLMSNTQIIVPKVIRPAGHAQPKHVKVMRVKFVRNPRALPRMAQTMEAISQNSLDDKCEQPVKVDEEAPHIDFKRYLLSVHYHLERKMLNSSKISKASKAIQKKGFKDELRSCIKHNKSLRQFRCLSVENQQIQKELMRKDIQT